VVHNYNDDYDAACQVSILHGQRKWCWQCQPGYLLLEVDDESYCVANDQCNSMGGPKMVANTNRRYPTMP
jgi:hypothetical protein